MYPILFYVIYRKILFKKVSSVFVFFLESLKSRALKVCDFNSFVDFMSFNKGGV